MPTRMIRDGILTSERIASLTWAEECFYRRLMSVVDDYGRYYAHPSLLRAACYPLQINKVSDSDIVKWLACVQKAGLVRVYPASDGKSYLEILYFGQRVQSKSKFPAFNGDSGNSTVNHGDPRNKTALVGDEVEDGDEGSGPGPAAPDPPVIALQTNSGAERGIAASEYAEMRELYPAVDVMGELRKMRGWLTANPARRKTSGGMLKFVHSWLAKEQDKGRQPPTNHHPHGSMPELTL